MFNKDVTHPKMRRHIVNPRILLLDCPLEYKKGMAPYSFWSRRFSDGGSFWSVVLIVSLLAEDPVFIVSQEEKDTHVSVTPCTSRLCG